MQSYCGQTILNYRLDEKLGEGGGGTVYVAIHETLGRRVAIKILRQEHARDGDVVERFLREARLVCTIGHPDIVVVENSGRLESGEPFYIMEFVEGRSLAAFVADQGPLSYDELRRVFAPIAAALAAAHDKNVIHRDLKPHNVMIREQQGSIVGVKLLDFGIAKLLDATDASRSHTGDLLGTPNFMAPEQARDSKNVDARADVYGFAATFFAAATGEKPFDAPSLPEVLGAVQRDAAPLLSEHRADAPPALVSAVARCLAKDPEDRPASIRQAWQLLAGALTEAKDSASGRPHTATQRDARRQPSRRGLRRNLAVVGAVIGLGGAMAWFGTHVRRNEARSPFADAAVVANPVVPPIPPPPSPPPAAAPASEASVGELPPAGAPASNVSTGAKRVTGRLVRRPPVAPVVPPARSEPAPVSSDCTKPSFAAVYDAPSVDPKIVRAALDRLKGCREGGHIEAGAYAQIQAALIGKL